MYNQNVYCLLANPNVQSQHKLLVSSKHMCNHNTSTTTTQTTRIVTTHVQSQHKLLVSSQHMYNHNTNYSYRHNTCTITTQTTNIVTTHVQSQHKLLVSLQHMHVFHQWAVDLNIFNSQGQGHRKWRSFSFYVSGRPETQHSLQLSRVDRTETRVNTGLHNVYGL
jgi:hypothetical protein